MFNESGINEPSVASNPYAERLRVLRQITMSPPAGRVLLPSLAVFAALFGLAVFLQWLNGAFSSEFNAYPDEPAHYVTSLMIREYLVSFHYFSPIQFARDYYHHYPKVAFGHWPPAFYLLQALWMLVFTAARASVRLELAFITTVLAFSIFREFRRWFGAAAALFSACLLICLPLVQNSTDEEMAETLLVLCCFWSSIYFARYLESAKLSDAMWFGFYFSATVLTKGSGWLLTLIPIISILFTRRVFFLLKSSFWYAVALIGVLCLPWQLATLRSAQRGWTGGPHPSIGYTFSALGEFFPLILAIVGPLLSILIGLGIIVTVIKPALQRGAQPVPTVMFALFVSDWLFHSLVPAGVEDRKMILAVPALLYFLNAGAQWLLEQLPRRYRLAPYGPVLGTLAVIAIFAVQAFSIPRSDHYGYSEAAAFAVRQPKLEHATLLVSSGSIGEGLLISEIAMRRPRPRCTIVRATKELAQVDWSGAQYRSFYKTPDELLHYLTKRHIDAVVLDTYNLKAASFKHQALVDQTLREQAPRFRLLASFNGRVGTQNGKVEIYEFLRGAPGR